MATFTALAKKIQKVAGLAKFLSGENLHVRYYLTTLTENRFLLNFWQKSARAYRMSIHCQMDKKLVGLDHSYYFVQYTLHWSCIGCSLILKLYLIEFLKAWEGE
jgi:hypothetical protein